MTERLNDEEAFAIADAVLSRHGYDAGSPTMGGVADGLGIASDEIDIWTASAIYNQERYERRRKKIDQLRALISIYKHEAGGRNDHRASIHGCSLSDTDSALYEKTGRDLIEQIGHLNQVLDIELDLEKKAPRGGRPNSRPPKSKNVGAECIYDVLRENDIKPWTACSIIAEMLIEAGIDDRSHRKVLRSLFDKLNRKEVR